MKRDIKSDYRGWRFRDKVNLIPRDQQWKSYFDEKFANIDIDIDCDFDFDPNEIIQPIENVIEVNVQNGVETINNNIDEKLCKVHKHIEDAKDHLCCDICCAKNDIKNHIDEKIEPILLFEEDFSNLNEQVQTIIDKLNEQ